MAVPYVSLERTFLSLRTSSERDAEVEVYLTWHGLSPGISWSELLENRCVVVLGEARSGKTTEFRRQAEQLKKAGRAAFFLRIERLLDESFARAFEQPDDARRFDDWLAHEDSEAIFFLDSVDEARLRDVDAFDKALQRLREQLEGHEWRVRLFVSCRASDWHYLEDQRVLEDVFPVRALVPGPSEERRREVVPDEGVASFRVVQLRALSSEQVATLCREMGLEDTEAFIEALQKAGAEAFAHRPGDVEWLVAHWKDNRPHLGTLRELAESNLLQKLKEDSFSHERREGLSLRKAREGAEELAAALVLCGKAELVLPDPGISKAASSALDAREILTDWNGTQLGSLLTRAIFDEATYGRVRFHHRSVREYLAACWFTRLLARGGSRAELLRLFTREVSGRRVVIHSLKGVLGWMAAVDEGLQQEILQFDPGLLLHEGDPEALSEATRERLLLRLVEHYGDRKNAGFRPGKQMLLRFVSKSLGPSVRNLLASRPRTNDLRELLLELVAHGRLDECSELALQMALDEGETVFVREEAIRAVASCARKEHCEQLAAWARQSRGLHPDLTRAITLFFFPEWLEVDACIELLRHIEPTVPFQDVGLAALLQMKLAARCPRGTLEGFLEALLTLTEPSKDAAVKSKYWWVPGLMAHLIIRILESRSFQTLKLDLLARAFAENQVRSRSKAYLSYHRSDTPKALAAALHSRRGVRSHFFWFCLRSRPDLDGWRLRDLLCVEWLDVDWLVEGAVATPSGRAFDTALDSIHQLWLKGDQAPGKREYLLGLAKGDARVMKHLEALTLPRPAPVDDSAEQARAWEMEQREQFEAWRNEALGRREQLSSGQDADDLHGYLIQISARMPKDLTRRRTQSRWGVLEADYGRELVKAAKVGCRRFWRTGRPPLRAELAFEDLSSVSVGLSGLQTELDEGLALSQLTGDERALAARYALCEQSSLPEWFSQLARDFPKVVEGVLYDSLKAEFERKEDERMGRSLLGMLAEVPALEALFVPLLLELLEEREPWREQGLSEVLDVLLRSGLDDRDGERLAALSRERLGTRSGWDAPGWLPWLVTWLHTDGTCAWDFVEQRLQEVPEARQGRLVQLAVALHWQRGHRGLSARPSFHAPAILRRMIAALYRDLPRGEGGLLSRRGSEEERHAWEIRAHLCQSLSGARGDEAQHELLSLARDASLEGQRDYFLYLADLQAQGDAHFQAWSPQRFTQFRQRGVIPSVAPRVFLSYRREDSEDLVGRIRDRLVQRFGANAIFKDTDSIGPAAEVQKEIELEIQKSDALLVIIGERWMRRRPEQSIDYVQFELETAFRHRIPVFPVLIRGTSMPRAEDLAESIRVLCDRNATSVRPDPDFHRDMDVLIDALQRIDRPPPNRGS